MTNARAIELLIIEKECVQRASGIRHNASDPDYWVHEPAPECNRDCEHCDIVQNEEELISMYEYAIEILKEKII